MSNKPTELLRLAHAICEDNRIMLAEYRVSHPEGCTFHNSERVFTVHGKDGDRRQLGFALYEYIAPDSGLFIPDHELLERAGTALLEEAQRLRKESGW